ncbi:glycerol-3-phosphate acyltransferase 2, mitochondrial isoform X1 [Denticeps clupeoides]|nr:glycerol-3-phosphate acyltransferase 2, mitochondrial-like isoform X1 [Denticeps clupeoides]XP_028852859.1 glycerol-3-phosphate acyltransferase 2, mitochondrial-like isoform X1 [Denticeps clupeoides]XP_028852861.1 glycerol-3-phosphate acyltransferase 2, mitochondrial-like isoform X1 [Denticeps clupeoides]
MELERRGVCISTQPVTHSTLQRHRPMFCLVNNLKKQQTVTPFLGRFRPLVGQSCHQCNPGSLGHKFLQNSPSLGFKNILCVKETQTRYRGWLIRRVCCVLFVSSCRTFSSSTVDRMHRICSIPRVQKLLSCTISRSDDKSPDSAASIKNLVNASFSPVLLRLTGWILLKFFSVLFCSVQVNLNQMAALHKATQLKTPLVFVSVRQSSLDLFLIPLVLFCHSMRVPYCFSPVQVNNSWLRFVLQKMGVILFPAGVATEQDAETDDLYSTIMTSLVGALLQDGESISICVSQDSVHGSQWMARIRQAMSDNLVPDANLVPVGVSYDCPFGQCLLPRGGVLSALWFVLSLLCRDDKGSVRIHFAQAFSLKEMCETGRCCVDNWCPVQELPLTSILHKTDAVFGQKSVSSLLPSSWMPGLQPEERNISIALMLHLLYSTTSCMAVMSTHLLSSLMLHKHRKGVRLSVLCRDMVWLLEEVLFRGRDVGFAGSLVEVIYQALRLLSPYLLQASLPPRNDPLMVPQSNPTALLTLAHHSYIITHAFILEAVGASAVSAMLSEVARRGGTGEIDDLVLCQKELTDKATQLIYLLPAGYVPPCQSTEGFALDAVESLVRCGILMTEEVPCHTPVCDFMKKQCTTWYTTDDPDHSDSDCEEQDTCTYKLSHPVQCPEMLFFLCSLLNTQLRALCWAIECLHLLPTPLLESECLLRLHAYLKSRSNLDKIHYESASIDLAKMSIRTFSNLGVVTEENDGDDVYLDLNPAFLEAGNRHRLHQFVSQYLCTSF